MAGQGFHHVAIRAIDFDATLKFYAEEPTEGALLHFCFRVADVEAAYTRALTAGAVSRIAPMTAKVVDGEIAFVTAARWHVTVPVPRRPRPTAKSPATPPQKQPEPIATIVTSAQAEAAADALRGDQRGESRRPTGGRGGQGGPRRGGHKTMTPKTGLGAAVRLSLWQRAGDRAIWLLDPSFV